ncbi:hypothetical protein MTP99_015119 [Tenebrio molitor]|nr:hypothetical protein MTP99_015119 [Tenebrio molitor]
MLKCESFSLVVILICSSAICGQHLKHESFTREKRTLVWPPGGSKLLAICGFGVPVDLKARTVIFGTVFKANYKFPTNATQITNPIVTYARKKRAATRWDLYAVLGRALEMRGFVGKSCVLRTICEVAATPLEKNFGLFHELIHTVFTPTTTNEKVDQHSDNEYYAAQFFGQKKRNCGEIFSDCGASFLDTFTFNTVG